MVKVLLSMGPTPSSFLGRSNKFVITLKTYLGYGNSCIGSEKCQYFQNSQFALRWDKVKTKGRFKKKRYKEVDWWSTLEGGGGFCKTWG